MVWLRPRRQSGVEVVDFLPRFLGDVLLERDNVRDLRELSPPIIERGLSRRSVTGVSPGRDPDQLKTDVVEEAPSRQLPEHPIKPP